jgi:hypothetical protein
VDGLLHAIVVDLEVFRLEAADGPAFLIECDHVDVNQACVDLKGESRRLLACGLHWRLVHSRIRQSGGGGCGDLGIFSLGGL